MIPTRVALVATLLCFATSPLLADPATSAAGAGLWPRGETIAVTADPINDSAIVATAVQEGGSFLVLWARMDDPRTVATWHLFAQDFDAAGTARGTAHEIARGLYSAQLQALPGGGYLLAWERGGLGPDPLLAQFLDGQGEPLGAPFPLSDMAGVSAYENYLRLAVAEDGGFAAVWAHSLFHTTPQGTLAVDKQFRLRRFAPDGTPRGPSTAINSLAHVSNGDGGFADIAAVPGGGFCTVWSWELTPGATASLHASRFDTAGVPTTPALFLGSAGVQGYAYSNFPRVAAHPDRSCTLAWVSLDGPGYEKHIHIQLLGADGSLSADRTAPPTDTDYGFGFQLAPDRHGGVYLLDATGYGHPFSPFPPAELRRLDARGEPTGEPLAAVPGGFFGGITLAANAKGDVVVAWAGNGQGTYPDHHDILARRFRAGCAPAAKLLCLGEDGRFALSATWRTPSGQEGQATAIPVTSDTGGFWFFSPANLELLAKVLDGRAVNGHFWLLFGGLTNLDVQISATDALTGATRTYSSPAGRYPSRADVQAFADNGQPPSATAGAARRGSPPPVAATAAPSAACATGATALCLGGRFRVELTWRDPAGNRGDGHPVAASDGAGYLWFFSPDNLEMAIKILDGTAVNGHQWIFVAGLTDLEYALTVTDTATGSARTYANPPRSMRSFADTSAF